MKTKIVYTLQTFLFMGISTSVNAQTNAVLNYPVPEKKQVSKANRTSRLLIKSSKQKLMQRKTTMFTQQIPQRTRRKHLKKR